MDGIFCNTCGHRNPPGSNFCSSCGAPLAVRGEDHTITFLPPDTAQDAPGPDDDVVVRFDELPSDVGVLMVRTGPNAGMRLPLTGVVTRLGRHPDSELFLDDITVSRRHVEIRRNGPGYLVKDVGSLNGTYLNRERVEEAPLHNGDELQVGKFRLVFLLTGAPSSPREPGGAP